MVSSQVWRCARDRRPPAPPPPRRAGDTRAALLWGSRPATMRAVAVCWRAACLRRGKTRPLRLAPGGETGKGAKRHAAEGLRAAGNRRSGEKRALYSAGCSLTMAEGQRGRIRRLCPEPSPMISQRLWTTVVQAAEAADAWRQGRIDISSSMEMFRRWAQEKGLKPSETRYLRARLDRRIAALAEAQLDGPVARDTQCHECGAEVPKSSFLLMEAGQPLCLPCAGLGDLEFLAAGDTALTRRATKHSGRVAVVVRFSRSRKRHEPNGSRRRPPACGRSGRGDTGGLANLSVYSGGKASSC